MILLFAMTVFFALFHLTESPAFNSDEGWYMQSANNLLTTGMNGLQLAPGYIDRASTYTSVGYPLIYMLALCYKLIGVGILQARLLMVFFLLAFTVISFLLVRRLSGNGLALMSLLLISTFPPLYGNGKAVMGEMPGLFFMVLTLYLFNLITVYPSRKTLLLILTGISAGIFMATKVSFILFAPALIVAAIIEWRRGHLSLKDIGLTALSIVAPLAVWLLIKFLPGESISTILGFYANPSRVNDITGTVLRNIKTLFSDTSTIYTMSMLVIWASALWVRFYRKMRISAEETAAFILATLTIASFTRTAGFYRYLLPAQMVALIFFPGALLTIFETISKKITTAKSVAANWVVMAILGVLGLYQLCFHSYVADSYRSHAVADMQAYFDSIPATTTMFFYNSQGLVPFFHGKNYFQYLILFNKEDWTIGSENLPILAAGKADMVVAGPHSLKDDAAAIFEKYVVVHSFGKIDIMKHR